MIDLISSNLERFQIHTHRLRPRLATSTQPMRAQPTVRYRRRTRAHTHNTHTRSQQRGLQRGGAEAQACWQQHTLPDSAQRCGVLSCSRAAPLKARTCAIARSPTAETTMRPGGAKVKRRFGRAGGLAPPLKLECLLSMESGILVSGVAPERLNLRKMHPDFVCGNIAVSARRTDAAKSTVQCGEHRDWVVPTLQERKNRATSRAKRCSGGFSNLIDQ
jgi:hypothetical protein